MEALQSPTSTLDWSSTSTRQAPPRKLRDSCYNCATSKLKCSKDKPTCARCQKQGKTCVYIPSKRAGRTQTTRSSGSVSSASINPTSAITPPATVSHSPDPVNISLAPPPSGLPALFPSAGDSSAPSPSTFTSEFFDFDDTVMSWSILDTPGATSNLDGDTIIAAQADANSFVDLSSLQASVFSTPKTSSYMNDESYSDSTSITNFANPIGQVVEQATSSEDPSSEAQCSCMSRALWMLQQLSSQSRGSNGRKGSSGMNTLGHQRRNSEDISPQSIVAQNKKNIQNILTMAECSCLEDPYLLSIMCFLVFQVLTLYKAAVSGSATSSSNRSSDRSSLSPDVVKSQTGEDEEQMRKVAQSVLGELHLVQRLINVLSRRLKDYAAQGGGEQDMPTSMAVDDKPGFGLWEEGLGLTLSAGVLCQLDVDLRKQLRALSCRIVDILRRV